MRFYSWVNSLYLSQLQYGIQTAHAIARMSLRDNENFKNWAEFHETIIVLSGINQQNLIDIHADLYDFREMIPELQEFDLVQFNEDKDSLNNAVTCVGMIIPEIFYSGSHKRERDGSNRYYLTEKFGSSFWSDDTVGENRPKYEFAKYLSSFKLAGT